MIELTVEKAIEILRKTYKEDSDGYQEHLVRGGGLSAKHEEWLEALGMAIYELKKQIPLKIHKMGKYGDITFGRCKCSNDVNSLEEYCPKCGQKLDWSDENE